MGDNHNESNDEFKDTEDILPPTGQGPTTNQPPEDSTTSNPTAADLSAEGETTGGSPDIEQIRRNLGLAPLQTASQPVDTDTIPPIASEGLQYISLIPETPTNSPQRQ